MRTISEAMIQWLYGFGRIDIDEDITTDQLDAMAAAYGLYRTPQTTVKNYVDGTRDITAYYRFLARQRSQTEKERVKSQQWMEALEQWVFAENRAGRLPDLGDGRTCQMVKVANTSDAAMQDEKETVYQVSLSINYIDERRE